MGRDFLKLGVPSLEGGLWYLGVYIGVPLFRETTMQGNDEMSSRGMDHFKRCLAFFMVSEDSGWTR